MEGTQGKRKSLVPGAQRTWVIRGLPTAEDLEQKQNCFLDRQGCMCRTYSFLICEVIEMDLNAGRKSGMKLEGGTLLFLKNITGKIATIYWPIWYLYIHGLKFALKFYKKFIACYCTNKGNEAQKVK